MEIKEFERKRLTTQMNEMVHVMNTSVYKSEKDNARRTLNIIQEAYKTRFGSYSKDHMIDEGARVYSEMSIDDLVKVLEDLKSKHSGNALIQVHGSLLCKDDGNSIILSNEKQM